MDIDSKVYEKLKEKFGVEFETDEERNLFKPYEDVLFMVIEHYKTSFEIIRLTTHNEIEVYKRYKQIKHKDKVIIRANIIMSDAIEPHLILGYEEIEKVI